MNNIYKKILILSSLFFINNPWPDFLTRYWPFEKESIKIQREREEKRNKDYDQKLKKNNYSISEMIKNDTNYYIDNDIDENSISTNFIYKEELINGLRTAKKYNTISQIDYYSSLLSQRHNQELITKRDQGLSKEEREKEIRQIEKEIEKEKEDAKKEIK
jgi:hypothetical protein